MSGAVIVAYRFVTIIALTKKSSAYYFDVSMIKVAKSLFNELSRLSCSITFTT